MGKTLCFTGHRPEKLNGYNVADNLPLIKEIKKRIEWYIENKDVDTFITGMAQGVDTWSAQLIIRLREKYPHIKLISAIPCSKHYAKWYRNPQAIATWKQIYVLADKRVYVSNQPYTAWCMQKRNEYMVDNSTYVLAIWDGSKGGTANCVRYAQKMKKEIDIINPSIYRVA